MSSKRNPGSFRDPGGFLFQRDNTLYRQVNQLCRKDYDFLMSSGLYKTLTSKKLLIPHEETGEPFMEESCGYKVIQPEVVPFISYPYEWSFSQLKDAALTTIAIQKIAFEKGMSLKDSSAYNIQFLKGKPVFIDTLSFEVYREGEPWVAYRQFCQHFLAPLALMSIKDVRLGQLLRIYIDGIPLDLAASILPASSRFNLSLYMHIILHGKSQKRYEYKTPQTSSRNVSKLGFQGIIESLEKAVRKLKWNPHATEWGDYYEDTNYSEESHKHKEKTISGYIDAVKPETVWDLGANDGRFSRIAGDKNIHTVAFDVDPLAVEKNYQTVKSKKETDILPLLLDLTNPSSGAGWESDERSSFIQRGPVDLILALALIHHLAISNNVPLEKVAAFFSRLCQNLIIEFVPKSDSQVKRLLATREDIFPDYTPGGFETAFSNYFSISESKRLKDSDRILYLLTKKN